MKMFVTTIIREHSDSETDVHHTEQEALAWCAKALFLVEEGRMNEGDPPPSFEQMRKIAGDYGWEITLDERHLA